MKVTNFLQKTLHKTAFQVCIKVKLLYHSQFYNMLNPSRKIQFIFQKGENGKNVAMHTQSPAMEKKEQMCVCAPINSYSVTAVKTVLFLCIVMYRLLEDFSPFLQELLLCSYFLSTCNEVLIISSTTLKINSCLLL